MCEMSGEIFDYLKRERDICVKTIIPSQNTTFMLNPTLRPINAVKPSDFVAHAARVR